MMDETIKSRVDALVERKIQNEEQAARKARAEAEAAEQREARKAAAQTRWITARADLETAMAQLNENLTESGLELFFDKQENQPAVPGIGRVVVGLKDRGTATRQRLVFNVSAFGQVQLIIPHTGPQMADFDIAESTVERFQGVLLDFLELCTKK